LFSCFVPLTSIFGFLFFGLKYWVDKYNMIYVYVPEFESRGKLRKKMLPLSLFAVIFFQILNFGFLAATINKEYYGLGITVIGIQLVAIYVFKVSYIDQQIRQR